jgi:hypothetical protein
MCCRRMCLPKELGAGSSASVSGSTQLQTSTVTHTRHLALQQYFSHHPLSVYLKLNPTHTYLHEFETINGFDLLITKHLNQSIPLNNQEQVLDYVSLNILGTNVESQSISFLSSLYGKFLLMCKTLVEML